jgi:hypothetical protein
LPAVPPEIIAVIYGEAPISPVPVEERGLSVRAPARDEIEQVAQQRA